MTDTEHYERIVKASDALNEALSDAAQAGLTVAFHSFDIGFHGAERPIPHIEVTVERTTRIGSTGPG